MNELRPLRNFDSSQDGPTGQEQDILCWACNKPMVSREWIVAGVHLWSTIHATDQCHKLATQILYSCADRSAKLGPVAKSKKPKKNAFSPTADP